MHSEVEDWPNTKFKFPVKTSQNRTAEACLQCMGWQRLRGCMQIMMVALERTRKMPLHCLAYAIGK